MFQLEVHRWDLGLALAPPSPRGKPLCLFLYGGGGSRESLTALTPMLTEMMGTGVLAEMVVATPEVGPWSFYLDDPDRGMNYESLVVDRFVPLVRETTDCGPLRAIAGVSMGGYGALKIAFAHAGELTAVAAISPMIEPTIDANDVPPRNRHHYPSEVPDALLGPARDAALYRRDHPAARAMRNPSALHDLAIYIDAAGSDAFNAHDGAEYLHRVLWSLDVAHDYRLRMNSDHVGPDLVDRIREALSWISAHLAPEKIELDARDRDAEAWLEGPRDSPAPVLVPTSPLFGRVLRAQLEPQRRAALAIDPTTARRFGLL